MEQAQTVSSTRDNANIAARLANAVPPHVYFGISAVFHYLGPAFAVLLFARVDVIGVAWLRIATAAVVFSLWRRPWRTFQNASAHERAALLAMGVVLACMNSVFYLAIARLPLGTVGAIEFIGPILIAIHGSRTLRNLGAVLIAAVGVYLLMDVRFATEPTGFLLAFANCALFMLYVGLGHRAARDGGAKGIERLGASMFIALIVLTPIGFSLARPALTDWRLLGAGVGIGLCSSVIPYVCDQLSMARLSRATFALLLALLPACGVLIGALVLRQFPSAVEVAGITLIVAAVALHRARAVN